MNEQILKAGRRRNVGITEIVGHHRQAHACAELIDVLLRRDDLEHREELRSAAEELRWLFPNHTTRMTLAEVRVLIRAASVVARVAGLARHVWLPTLAHEIQRGIPKPYANVLDAAASFFALVAREQDRQEDGLFRDELIRSAIRLSRIAGQVASYGVLLEQHEMDVAAGHLLEAMRLTVALIDWERVLDLLMARDRSLSLVGASID